MADDPGEYQPLNKASDFRVHSVDGYVTLPLTILGGDISLQMNFWTYEATPHSENNKLRYDDPLHYKMDLRHTVQTAVRVNPTVAYALARTILASLQKLSGETRARYGLPSNIPIVEGLKL